MYTSDGLMHKLLISLLGKKHPVDPEHTENQCLFYALDLNFDLLPLMVTEYQ